jgi:hypothetical protein
MTLTHDAAGNVPVPWEEPDDDDLEDQPPGRRLSWLTGLLAVLVVGGGAFLAGVQVQKHHDKGLTTVSTAATGTAARTSTGGTSGSGTAGSSTGTGRGFGAGATIGQVKLIDGSTIYVTDTSGNTVTVSTTGASTFTKSESVSLKDIQPGDTIIVRGAAQPDGTITAAAVTDSGAAGSGALAGGFGRFGGGGFGGGRGAGSTGSGTGSGATGGGATTGSGTTGNGATTGAGGITTGAGNG